MIPPDASSTTLDLIYQYTYDNEDKLLSKKIPGKGIETYLYNNKDLVAASQDAVQASKNPKEWIVNSYDINGRLLKSGLYVGNTSPNVESPTFTQVYHENIYGTAAIYKDKIKTAKTNILGTTNMLSSTYTYDTRGRVQSVNSNNVHNISSFNVTNYTYDNADNLLTTVMPTTITSGTTLTYTISKTHTYDHRGRLLADQFKYNTGTTKTVGAYTYNWRDEITRISQGLPYRIYLFAIN